MKKVLILLADGFELYEAAAFIDTLGWAKVFGSEPIETVTAGFSERLHCTFGFEDSGKPISSICVGALPVARSGVLQGRNATTYHLLDGIRKKELGSFGANVLDAPVVRDKNITTSSSPSTAIEVAFDLLERITSRENADHISELMGFDQTERRGN